jgi:hypothetical protein
LHGERRVKRRSMENGYRVAILPGNSNDAHAFRQPLDHLEHTACKVRERLDLLRGLGLATNASSGGQCQIAAGDKTIADVLFDGEIRVNLHSRRRRMGDAWYQQRGGADVEGEAGKRLL